MYFSDRKYPREGVVLCACVSDEYGAFWKLIKYKVYHPYANIQEIRIACEQCSDCCDKIYIMKIYENKTKEELTEYFNKKFGYRRSYLYLRNGYLREVVIFYNNKLYFKERCTKSEWDRLSGFVFDKKASRLPRAFFDLCVRYQLKDPTFMDRAKELVEYHIKLNDGKDVRAFKD